MKKVTDERIYTKREKSKSQRFEQDSIELSICPALHQEIHRDTKEQRIMSQREGKNKR